MPPARKTAGLDASLCRRKEPDGPSSSISVPNATVFNERLKAVARILVVMVSFSSKGALERVYVRVLPSSSVSGGLIKVISTCCPALYWNPSGFSKLKDIVAKHTSSLPVKDVL